MQTISMDYTVLKEIGLSETECKVYLALLALGSAQAGEITQKAEINRTNVYDALERLINKGLVSFVFKGKKKNFEPSDPTKLKELLKEKETKLEEIIGNLIERYNSRKNIEKATIFKGKTGVKLLLELLLKNVTEIWVYGAQGKFLETFPVYRNIWEGKRVRLKIRKRNLYNESTKKEKLKEKPKFAELRFLPKEYDFPSTVLISGERVATIVWSEQPFAFVVNSEEVAKSNRNFFELLWKIAKK